MAIVILIILIILIAAGSWRLAQPAKARRKRSRRREQSHERKIPLGEFVGPQQTTHLGQSLERVGLRHLQKGPQALIGDPGGWSDGNLLAEYRRTQPSDLSIHTMLEEIERRGLSV